jgi:signal transduction histidine kinase
MNVLVHTPADTVGTIAADEAGGRIVIEVGDDGPGVQPDQLPHIFERFYRAAGSRSRLYSLHQPAPTDLPDSSHQPAPTDLPDLPGQPTPAYLPAGSGLGLAIAAEIAAAHGGIAQAAPATPRGLRITLTVPVCELPHPISARELAAATT